MPNPSIFQNFQKKIFPLLIVVVLSCTGCVFEDKSADPVAVVIESLSDSLPIVFIPPDADPESENWVGADLGPKEPVKPLYPEEQAKKFLLPEGYRMEPILTEPKIEQPGAIAFDGNGRMYVLELRTYMLTADSDGELEPTSRISRWEDSDNDGVYETGSVFIDNLVFPRFVLPYGKDCILAMESNQDEVFKYTDTNGDGVADKKELFTNNFGRSGNVEHQQAFLYYGMDNWLYSTVNAFRVKETSAGVIREPTGYNRAQWGITHDDDGKLWFLGGASGLPSYFQFPIHYGTFNVENQFAEGFEVPWGAPILIGDMQGGMDQIRKADGSLNRVTGAAGNDIYRGDRLPKSLYGQLLYGEPVARIVRQVNPVVNEGLTTLHNVYQEQKSEFIRSTDPLFRPVDMTTAPDGTLYVTDMYHGIIQEGQWAQKGTYLRTKIEQYQLDKVIQLGRIWRLSHKDLTRDMTKPKMLDQAPKELVQYLSHPNGWWRDKAQQLIVLSGDTSVRPQLEKIAKKDKNLLARFHALWSLEGLGVLSEDLVKELMNDDSPRMKIQAMRAGETLVKKGNKALREAYINALEDKNTDVIIQAMMSAKHLKMTPLEDHIKLAMSKNKALGVQVVGEQILNPSTQRKFGSGAKGEMNKEEIASLERGAVIFNELCVQCHGADGTGTLVGNGQTLAPALTGSPRVQWHPDYVIKTIMRGLKGPLDGVQFPGGVMVGNQEQSDQWIADISSFIRRNLGNEASMVSAEKVKNVREVTSHVSLPYTFDELKSSVPQLLGDEESVIVTASHSEPTRIGGTASPIGAFNFEGWTTGVSQQVDMWFQVELPKAQHIAEIRFNSPTIWRRGNWTRESGLPRPEPLQTYPRSFKLLSSIDGITWDEVAQVLPTNSESIVDLADVELKFLKIVLLESLPETEDIPWSMNQFKIYKSPEKPAISKIALK